MPRLSYLRTAKPAFAMAPASWPRIGTPETSSSRSCGPLPPTSTTAGSRPPTRSGLDSVPTSVKPLPPIFTCSSLAREIVTRRDETAAMSSRTTSRPWAGIVRRTRCPLSSLHTSASSGVPEVISAIASYHAPTSALPRAGLSFSVAVLTTIRSMISPGICVESNTLWAPGMATISDTSGFQVTTEVTSPVP